ncbi:hypothetical protein FHW69_002469 [Luteibacter sp. Sphag1AF]|uniref:hypothetical protein n=1 Tax=Luteibacter sp. Sphag1AF TaxID=2587031 RepID=UPI0016136E08|nr:hypothetical protein [Luteibacter sp. Sphag1AF]MBB3227837.1 hypothetical protein [Luteibacter sp. Sphag1AF]
MTFSRYAIALALASLVATSPIQAGADDPALRVVLSKATSPAAAEKGSIVVTVTNTSQRTWLLPIPFTPLQTPDGHLYNEIFTVTDANGAATKFIGRRVRVIPEPRETFYTRLEPGATASKEVDLSADYDLRAGGPYQVRYTQTFQDTAILTTDEVHGHEAQSNTLDIWVNAMLQDKRQ